MVEFVVGSLLAPRVLFPPEKPTFPNSFLDHIRILEIRRELT